MVRLTQERLTSMYTGMITAYNRGTYDIHKSGCGVSVIVSICYMRSTGQTKLEEYYMKSQFKLDLIRHVMEDLVQHGDEWHLKSLYFNGHMNYEPDSTLVYSSFSAAKSYIIDQLIKE